MTEPLASAAAAAPSPAPPAAAESDEVVKSQQHILLLQMVAGSGAGAVAKTATAPLERIKIIFQVQVRALLQGGETADGLGRHVCVCEWALYTWLRLLQDDTPESVSQRPCGAACSPCFGRRCTHQPAAPAPVVHTHTHYFPPVLRI
jgi:hypothetical protein